MKFKKYIKSSYPEMEHRILKSWKQNEVFEQSITARPKNKNYIFYDGPPFITGLPHHGNLLSSVAKDVVPRFQTMLGKRVERRWGWDCHGLPAENFVEKTLNLKDKNAVIEYGIEKYILACKEGMVQTGAEWESTIERIARWVEFKDAYKTMDAQYMESVWWAFKELYKKGSIYEGRKVLMYCTRCATPVSKAEIAMDDSYQLVTDPSVYIQFQLTDKSVKQLSRYLKGINLTSSPNILAWTTTPWTLHANTALAVNPELEYSLVEHNKTFYIVATVLAEAVFQDKQPVKSCATFKGSVLAGLEYQPLFIDRGKNAHQIWMADYVTTDEGTGIVHLAPAYGEEDYELALEHDIPVVVDIDDKGAYKDGPWLGLYVWEVNKQIAKELYSKGRAFRLDYIQHSYPHCHRCQTKLMYKAHPSWFMDIEKQRESMVELNEEIEWFPKHIKHGRFHNIIMSAPDWNLSRDRFWATPLPVWRGKDDNGKVHTIVVGSYQELEELSGQTLDDYHRPWVDGVEFEKEGITYKRIDKVIDCWFESGSMPFAQFHYPFENKEKFENDFPADFIVEYVGQVRAWFYYLHAVSIGLFGKPAFRNVIVTGTVLGADGRKMSKSLGNYTDPMTLVETHSTDAYRLFLMSSTVMNGEDLILDDKGVANIQKRLNTLRSTLEFFLLYAEADHWQANKRHMSLPEPKNLLDQWVLARLAEVVSCAESHLASYDIPSATKPLIEFIDDLSNWYIRRNRKRFWKADSDIDKESAYHTLYFVLITLAKAIAPICPFIAEEVYTLLVDYKGSVHLDDWPKVDYRDDKLLDHMKCIRKYITDGLAIRASNRIKVRQPLSELTILDDRSDLPTQLVSIIAEELNVKLVHFRKSEEYKLDLCLRLTDELRQEGTAREVVRYIQALRKRASLDVDNRIQLSVYTDNKLVTEAIERFRDYIMAETLSNKLTSDVAEPYEHSQAITHEGKQVSISLQKAT